MEDIQLTESEQRYFGDLFACCDLENTGKIPLSKAAELFKSANLPIGILKQITDICGVGRSNYLERRQFYWTLKLIAAFQAGLPIRPELFQTNLDVPLPRFTRNNSMEKWERCHVNQSAGSPDLIQLSDTDRSLNQVAAGRMACNSEVIGRHSPTHNGRALSLSSGQKSRSPEASSTASDSPTPTNSVQERNWAAAAQWHGIVCEEQRQLLGTEEESSDRHSSDDDGDPSEVWTITEEQREYYTAQFLSLQPDPAGLVAGSVARLFFEKSRLPVHELRKIWQLADVTKDGALSIEEFNTAMHLVVLRRNNIDLPDCLPPTLAPPLPASVTQPSAPPQAPVQVTSVPPPTVVPVPEPTTTLVSADSPPSPSPSAGGDTDSPLRGSNKDVSKWTKFVDSPTSSVSSPGPKPVNFDFHKSAVEQDPKILHPVALRVTPESQGVSVVAAVASAAVEEEPCRSPRKPSEPQAIPYEQFGGSADSGSPKKVLSTAVTHTDAAPAEIRPIQRPQAKKPAALGPGAIPPPPQPAVIPTSEEVNSIPGAQSGPTSLPSSQIGPKKEPPPPPPPRPYRTHARSSSLDLNRLGKSGGLLGIPPVVPPRVSPSTTSPNKKLIGQHSEGDVLSLVSDQTGFADFGRFGQEEEETAEMQMPRKHGAFEVYRKPTARASDAGVGVLPEQDSPQDDSQQQRHQHEPSTSRPSNTLRQLQEQNTLLLRVCQELNQELAEVQEERASLEMQLEHLRSHLTE
ncbi:ralBP1-associated Eps domain-containing protein 2 isoform X1 [Schistocerca serialis cubense]|uniref:ralBP1-associated Eps domain-containing protein 2 isoform X1 n=2 Tax=Schistocerca serialis cubense TaxID=2023355 RepID=UPI00214E838E|nr:ralBP1-associated Eps domain-containing protein 2 isoform X1 [Schistocerca serialis cubense]